KPIDSQRLIATVEQLLSRARAESADAGLADSPGSFGKGEPAAAHVDSPPGSPKTDPADASPSPVDYAALLNRCSGNAALAGKVLDKLLAQMKEAVGTIDRSISQNDAAGLTRIAHSLKGAAGMASAEGLRAAAEQ